MATDRVRAEAPEAMAERRQITRVQRQQAARRPEGISQVSPWGLNELDAGFLQDARTYLGTTGEVKIKKRKVGMLRMVVER
jgi:hypothetical protein